MDGLSTAVASAAAQRPATGACKDPQHAELAVLMACHNRRDSTVACLRALLEASNQARLRFCLYLFDDGSTDGTAQAVRDVMPDAQVLAGDGTWFWNRSMHALMERAMREGHAMYLWLNDDTMLEPAGLTVMLVALAAGPRGSTLVVGAIRDPRSGVRAYGGNRRVDPRWRPFLGRVVEPSGKPEVVDMMNGNAVLLTDAVARRVGNLDPVFEHAMGDTDYALRAVAAGVTLLQTGRYVGHCSRNSTVGTMHDRTASIAVRLRHAISRKGLPPRSWLALCRKHAGRLWPLHFVWGYAKFVVKK